MDNLYDKIISLCTERGIKGGKMCTDIGMSKGILTDLKMGRQTSVSTATAQKIADYFGVSVGYLLGSETEKAPASDGKRTVSDDDIKFALFGGDGDITDAMFDEVKQFAAMVKLREDSKKKKE